MSPWLGQFGSGSGGFNWLLHLKPAQVLEPSQNAAGAQAKLFNVMGQQNLCPVKPLPDKNKAKEAAKSIVDQKRADPTNDMQELLAGALVQFV
jgi:hypothetical protein